MVIAEALFPGNPESQANAITNLSVFFQSLDEDGDRDNGRIAVPERARLTVADLGNLQVTLAQPPDDFRQGLDITVDDDGGPVSVNPVDPTDALLRFYRNELMGAWQATTVPVGR